MLSGLSTNNPQFGTTVPRARKMALLSLTPLTSHSLFPTSSSSTSVSSTLAINAAPISRLHMKSIVLHPKSFSGVRIVAPFTNNKRCTSIVRGSSEIDGSGQTEGGEPPSETEKEVVPVDQLPLESKEKEKTAQRLRMRLARKLRRRRSRLLRKRKMRKKGRWPPSKMKKLKNV